MCINAVNRLRKDLFPAYRPIKRHSEFEEYFIPEYSHPSYYWNSHIYTYLEHSLFVAFTNNNCINYSMVPEEYKVVNNHAHKISVWKILSRLIHSCSPNLGVVNGDVQPYLATLSFKNGEQHEYFHIRILRKLSFL